MKLLIIIAICSPGLAQAAAGKIEKVGLGSSVEVNRGGVTKRLKEGDALESGDELRTDASTAVDIRLEDETLIRLGMNSKYRIQEDSKIHSLVHRLLSGVVRVLVKPSATPTKGADVKFRMYTPEGTIGVRGTEFVVLAQEGKTEIKGLDGVVSFGPANTDFADEKQFVLVTGGFHSTVTAKGLSKPERYDDKAYRDTINSKAGPFAPIAGIASGGGGKYVRNETKAAPAQNPVKAGGTLASKPLSGGPAPKEAKKDEKAPVKVDYQLMLYQAAQAGNEEDAGKALAGGANVNGHDDSSMGHTPLEIAMLNGKDKMFVYLVSQGANVDYEDEKGLTPLMFAAQNHIDKEYAETLVYPGGADIEKKNKAGLTAADYAEKNDYPELAAYLNSKQAELDAAKARDEKAAREKEKKKQAGKKAPK